MQEYAGYASAIVAVVMFIASIINNRSKANNDRVQKIETALGDKANAIAVSALTLKVDTVEDRLVRIESDLKHLPDTKVTHRMELAIESLRADVKVLAANLKPVSAIAERMQDEMLERGRGA
jgi:predicted  nucleic acid-binding Zn-ribbon protein